MRAGTRTSTRTSFIGAACVGGLVAVLCFTLAACGGDSGGGGNGGGGGSSASMPDLGQLIGTKDDGWAPRALSGLKRGMTPEQAGKAMAGGEKVSEYGFSKVKPGNVSGVADYELYFDKKDGAGPPVDLHSITIHFDPRLNDEKEFWDALVKTCVAKYGEAKPADIEKKLITWIGPGFVSAQLGKGYTPAEGYQLKVSLEK